MPKKVLKMNLVGAPGAEKHANSNVAATAILVTEKIARCLKQFALLVVKRQQYHLSLPVIDLYIAEIASRQKEAVTTN